MNPIGQDVSTGIENLRQQFPDVGEGLRAKFVTLAEQPIRAGAPDQVQAGRR